MISRGMQAIMRGQKMSRYIVADDLKMELIGWETEPTDEDIERVIDNMPTADVAPVVHGHYITDEFGDSSCSVCGEKYLNITQNYCPQCGALLDGKDNEDG